MHVPLLRCRHGLRVCSTAIVSSYLISFLMLSQVAGVSAEPPAKDGSVSVHDATQHLFRGAEAQSSVAFGTGDNGEVQRTGVTDSLSSDPFGAAQASQNISAVESLQGVLHQATAPSSPAVETVTSSDQREPTEEPRTPLEPGWEYFPMLSDSQEQLVKASALHDRVLVLPPQRRESFSERSLKDAWEGNIPNLSTGIERLILRFRKDDKSSAAVDPKRDPPFFDVTLDMRGRLTVVTHSRLAHKSSRGTELVASERESTRKFIAGEGTAGIALLMPKVQLVGQQARALLLCPRSTFKIDRKRGQDEVFYVESAYRLSRVIAKMKASVEGKALTAGYLGLARASIVTSPNVARAIGWQDQSVAIDPRVTLSYVPKTTELIPDETAESSEVLAIEARLVLQRAAGFKRESIERTLVWVKSFELGAEEPWFIGAGAKTGTSRVAPGLCYTLLSETQSEQRYLKEPFEIPERLKGTP